MNNSNYSGRTSRTWNEARGPYASCIISEAARSYTAGDAAGLIVGLLTIIGFVVASFL